MRPPAIATIASDSYASARAAPTTNGSPRHAIIAPRNATTASASDGGSARRARVIVVARIPEDPKPMAGARPRRHNPRMRAGPPRLTRRDLRLASGLVLFTYVTAHLLNHAVGLWSLDAAESGLALAVRLWHSLPGTVLLYGAAGTHIGLALLSIYERRTLRMPPLDFVRILLGLGTPLLLIGHVVATRYASDAYGLSPVYSADRLQPLRVGQRGAPARAARPGLAPWLPWRVVRVQAPRRRDADEAAALRVRAARAGARGAGLRVDGARGRGPRRRSGVGRDPRRGRAGSRARRASRACATASCSRGSRSWPPCSSRARSATASSVA